MIRRILSKFTGSLAILVVTAFISGCATTSPGKRTSAEKRVKATSNSDAPGNFGLYTTKDIDRKLLRRGEQVRWSRSLDGY